MNKINLSKENAALLNPHMRIAYIPKTEEIDDDPAVSKFGGIPYLSQNAKWPTCSSCDSLMSFLFQLHQKDLPKGVKIPFKQELFQFFYCTECYDWEPFSAGIKTRFISMKDSPVKTNERPVEEFLPQQIVDWTPAEDLPNWEDAETTCGISNTSKEGEVLIDVYEDNDEEIPRPGDKLLGWPYWIQGLEYPNCPECDTQMDFFFQIDSEDNLMFMWGDVGCAQIFQCPNHPEITTLSWACS